MFAVGLGQGARVEVDDMIAEGDKVFVLAEREELGRPGNGGAQAGRVCGFRVPAAGYEATGVGMAVLPQICSGTCCWL